MVGGKIVCPRTRTSRVPVVQPVSILALSKAGPCGRERARGKEDGFWHTIPRFFETVPWVTVGCVDCDLVAEILQADCSVDNEPFCTADAEVWVEEDYSFGLHYSSWCVVWSISGHNGGVCLLGIGGWWIAGGLLDERDRLNRKRS